MQSHLICLVVVFLFRSQLSEAFNRIELTEKQKEVNFQMSYTDSSLEDIIWCGDSKKDNEVVLILTEQGSVYRSSNKGFEWQRLTDQFQKTGYVELEAGEKVGTVSRIMKSPTDPNFIIFLGTHGINWKSDNCGKSIIAMNQGRKIHEFQFHPTERNWILAAAWTLCEDFDEGEPCSIYKELYVSFDLGEKWKVIEDYVVQFSWGIIDETFLQSIPKERIILAHEPQGTGHQKITGWSEKVHLSYSDDFFKTSQSLVKFGNKFLLTHQYLFVAQVVNQEDQEVSLLISSPKQFKYSFQESFLPTRRFKEHSYTILDTSEGQVFLHVNHEGSSAKYGNIYISDSTGTRYSLSLKNNVRALDGQCDFEKVQNLEGIYLTNVYDQNKVNLAKGIQDQGIPMEKQGRNAKDKTEIHFQELDNYKKTMISFDKGGIWKSITAPLRDSNGRKISCPDENCSLHLHSVTNMRYGPFYSVQSAVGLILGTGNVGYHLANRPDEINTYLSRDGGVNWFEIKKGSHIYEMGDHGGLLVMAPDQEATNQVSFSWDEGISFQTFNFSSTPIEITNIIIEPTNTATSFVLYGIEPKSQKGVIVSLDFSSLHQSVCQNPDQPNSDKSDYELWSPNVGEQSPKCLMGRKINYIRRKRESQCYNGEEFERKFFVENCQCTEENWECDLGFSRDKEGPCKPTNQSQSSIDYSPPEKCDNFYYVSQGYRKIAGDSCVGGVNHGSIKIPCPGLMSLSRNNYIVLMVVLLLIVFLLLGGNNSQYMLNLRDFVHLYIFSKISQSIEKGLGLFSSQTQKNMYRDLEKDLDQGDIKYGDLVFEENEDKAEPLDDKILDEESNINQQTVDDNELIDFNNK